MLKILSSRGPLESASYLAENLDQIRAQKVTWLISDLKSKIEIQKKLLEKTDFIDAESVLRASELWRLLLFRVNPKWQIVSKEFSISLISQFLKDLKLSDDQAVIETKFFRAENEGFANTIYNYITQLMPALSHVDGPDLLREWLSENQDCQTRWGRWFELAAQVWQIFLREKYVAAPWTSGVLVNELDIDRLWKRNLVVDLGSELSQVESELLVMLSKFIDVTIIEPHPQWAKIYSSTLSPYHRLREATLPQKIDQEISTSTQQKIVYKKFSTELAEVKDVCAQVRKLAESGIPLSEIAVIAPDIEKYLPTALSYFNVEGIAFNRDVLARFNEFRDIGQWMAQLRLRLGLCNESDLEISIFGKDDRCQMKYEQFAKLFKFVYGREDLKRDQDVEKLFQIELDLKNQVNRDSFFNWTLKYFPASASFEKIDFLFKKIWAEIPDEQVLSVNLWLNYLQTLISKSNLKIYQADPNGIQILNLASCEHTMAKNLFIMGLSEEAFRAPNQTALTAFDVRKIAQDFGFQIFSPDQKRSEFQARWILEDRSRSLYLSFAVTDLAAEILSPSWLWLEGADKNQHPMKLELPELTRWDEIQTQSTEDLLNAKDLNREERVGFLDALKFQKKNIELKKVSLSASSIESYLECPFIFQATRVFKLSDQPSLDLDIDHMTRGSLVHKIFEKLTKNQPMRFDLSETEISTLIDEAKDENKMLLGDDRLWPSQKKKYIKIARRFLEFEKEWRRQFPKTRTVEQELKFSAEIDADELTFRKLEGTESKITFRGTIDRIDTDDEGNVVVIDYKSTGNGLTQYTSWIKSEEIQLILYSLAIEKNWTSLPPHQVVSAVYFVVQDMNRDRGFKLIGHENLFSFTDAKRNKIELAARDRLLQEAYELVQKTIARIVAGDFTPAPKKIEQCKSCKWRELCRAKHLSL